MHAARDGARWRRPHLGRADAERDLRRKRQLSGRRRIPIPGNYTCDPQTRSCQISVQWKKFGVGLNFTPVVLGEGRISLKVMSEVSELSNENALILTQSIVTARPRR